MKPQKPSLNTIVTDYAKGLQAFHHFLREPHSSSASSAQGSDETLLHLHSLEKAGKDLKSSSDGLIDSLKNILKSNVSIKKQNAYLTHFKEALEEIPESNLKDQRDHLIDVLYRASMKDRVEIPADHPNLSDPLLEGYDDFQKIRSQSSTIVFAVQDYNTNKKDPYTIFISNSGETQAARIEIKNHETDPLAKATRSVMEEKSSSRVLANIQQSLTNSLQLKKQYLETQQKKEKADSDRLSQAMDSYLSDQTQVALQGAFLEEFPHILTKDKESKYRRVLDESNDLEANWPKTVEKSSKALASALQNAAQKGKGASALSLFKKKLNKYSSGEWLGAAATAYEGMLKDFKAIQDFDPLKAEQKHLLETTNHLIEEMNLRNLTQKVLFSGKLSWHEKEFKERTKESDPNLKALEYSLGDYLINYISAASISYFAGKEGEKVDEIQKSSKTQYDKNQIPLIRGNLDMYVQNLLPHKGNDLQNSTDSLLASLQKAEQHASGENVFNTIGRQLDAPFEEDTNKYRENHKALVDSLRDAMAEHHHPTDKIKSLAERIEGNSKEIRSQLQILSQELTGKIEILSHSPQKSKKVENLPSTAIQTKAETLNKKNECNITDFPKTDKTSKFGKFLDTKTMLWESLENREFISTGQGLDATMHLRQENDMEYLLVKEGGLDRYRFPLPLPNEILKDKHKEILTQNKKGIKINKANIKNGKLVSLALALEKTNERASERVQH